VVISKFEFYNTINNNEEKKKVRERET